MAKRNRPDRIACVYGPVPSRRLGFSLGVDILDYKTCSLDCAYCQLGPTPDKVVHRKRQVPAEDVLSQIRATLAKAGPVDYITFSGSGEPTLHPEIGRLIREIKKLTPIPVAVLTNTTLMPNPEVRRSLLAADLVIPSLDAVTDEVFRKVNRPHYSLKIEDILDGLCLFRKEFPGKIWLEILFVKGLNDSHPHILKLKEAIQRIQPDEVHLNTVIRPPADKTAAPLTRIELERIREILGGSCEIIAEFKGIELVPSSDRGEEAILTMIRRRPVTLADIATSLGRHPNELLKILAGLIRQDQIRAVRHKGRNYYESVEGDR